MTELIRAELDDATRASPEWRRFLYHKPTVHIAVMVEPFLGYILSDHKTVESRFSLHKVAPYQKVRPGDVVLLKAGLLVGGFTVAWVQYVELKKEPIEQLINVYGQAICGDEAFWQTKRDKRYATLIGITGLTKLPSLRISKSDRRGWIVI